MQHWNLVGICSLKDWSEEKEDSGQVREWLKTRVDDLLNENDRIIGLRVNEILECTEKTQYEDVLEEVQNEFRYERDKAAAERLFLLQSYHFRGRKRKCSKRKNGGN
jgi:hypothetical protein